MVLDQCECILCFRVFQTVMVTINLFLFSSGTFHFFVYCIPSLAISFMSVGNVCLLLSAVFLASRMW